MNKVAVFVVVAAIVAASVALDCSDVVTKEQQGVLSWLGLLHITVPVSTGPAGWTMTLTFSQNFTGVGVWEGFVEYNGTAKWAQIRNRDENDAELVAGTDKSMRFRINYGLNIPIPELIGLSFQEIQLCK